MWDALGIPPTTDAAIIRRAYVARLKSLDVDREPAAFIRLRDAYEAALAGVVIASVQGWTLAIDDEAGAPGDVDPVPDDPDPVWTEAEALVEPEPYAVLDALIAEGRVGDAWASYNSFMATGAIGLDDQRPLAAMIVGAALRDPTVTPATFRTMAALLGTGDALSDHLSSVRQDAATKIAAYDWLDSVSADAARSAFWNPLWAIWNPLWNRRSRVLAARVFVGRRRRLGRSVRNLEALNTLMEEYSAQAEWLVGQVDASRLAVLDARAKRALQRKRRRDLIFLICFGVFCLVNVIYWNFIDPAR